MAEVQYNAEYFSTESPYERRHPVGEHGNGDLTFNNWDGKVGPGRQDGSQRGKVYALKWKINGTYLLGGSLLLWSNGTWWKRR